MQETNAFVLPDAQCLLPYQGKTDRNTLLMSLYLSRLAYDMDVAPFLDDGWQDISIQVDEMLLTDLKNRKSALQAAARARAKMEKLDPISQYRGFLRQKEELNACKAVVMAKQVNGVTLIAIAFTGTTRRMFEWLGNLRIETEEGFHAGFLQLTKTFEANAARVLFPSLGKSLQAVLEDMRNGSGQYRLFVTGHSQGAALMQLYVYRLLRTGVPRAYVRGVGFASPGVADSADVSLAADYPVVHVMNADDVIARVGGKMHVGMCRVMPATSAYRRACYGPGADAPAMREALGMLHRVRTTQEALLWWIALMKSVDGLPENEREEVFSLLMRLVLPEVLSQRLTGYAQRLANAAQRRLTAKCEKLFGGIDTEKLMEFQEEWDAFLSGYGAKESISTLLEVLSRPHALADRAQKRAYQTLAEDFEEQLVSCMWCRAGEPKWDLQLEAEKQNRAMRGAYDRFHPLQTQRRRNRDNL